MKLNKHAWIIWAIALFSVIALMIIIPFARTDSWWIAALCTIAMFGVWAYAFLRAFDKDDKLESKILGWPIFKVGYTALIVQIIVGAAVMALATLCPVWAAVVAELIVFAATGISLTIKDAARETIAQSEAKVPDTTAAWKAIRAMAVSMPEKVREALRYADPIPTELDTQIS